MGKEEDSREMEHNTTRTIRTKGAREVPFIMSAMKRGTRLGRIEQTREHKMEII